MTVTARRATSLGESESSLVEDDDDDDEFVIVRTHAHTHTRSNTQRVHRGGGGRALACRPSWTTNRPLDAGPVDHRRRTFTEAAGKKLEILEKVRNERRGGREGERRRMNENGKFRLGGQMSVVSTVRPSLRWNGTERVGWLVAWLVGWTFDGF